MDAGLRLRAGVVAVFQWTRQGSLLPLGLTAAALALWTAPSLAQENGGNSDLFGSIADFFNPNPMSKGPAIIDAVPYTVDIQIAGDSRSVRSAVAGASNLEILKNRPPSGSAGLVRRAISDFDRITAALYMEGYYAGHIEITVAGASPNSPQIFDIVERARKAGPVPVVVAVDPGPPFVFGNVRILDAATRRPMEEAPSLRALGLEPGEPARADQVSRAEAALVSFWRDKGHPFARITAKDVVADHAADRLNVTLVVEPGPYATFGPFIVSGADFLPPAFIE